MDAWNCNAEPESEIYPIESGAAAVQGHHDPNAMTAPAAQDPYRNVAPEPAAQDPQRNVAPEPAAQDPQRNVAPEPPGNLERLQNILELLSGEIDDEINILMENFGIGEEPTNDYDYCVVQLLKRLRVWRIDVAKATVLSYRV